MKVREFLDALRDGSHTHGYPKFFLCEDGGTLHPDCAYDEVWSIARAIRDKDNPSWRVIAVDINWEDPQMLCDHCDTFIESAYDTVIAPGRLGVSVGGENCIEAEVSSAASIRLVFMEEEL